MRKAITEINKYGKLEKLLLAGLLAWQSYRCMLNLNIFGRTPLWLCKEECFIEVTVICDSHLFDMYLIIYTLNLRYAGLTKVL